MRALVIDDETDIRTMVIKMLHRRGIEVAEATDGRDAISRLEAADYHLVVLDLMMPCSDGFAVIDHLIQERPYTLERTVVTTAYPRTALQHGVPGVCRLLNKPFTREEFDAAVDDCCRAN